MGIKTFVPEFVLILLFSFFLCQFPWTGQFSFEYSFFLCIFLFPLIVTSVLIRFRLSPKSLKNLTMYFLMLLGSISIVLLYSIKLGLCSFRSGLEWFLLLPLVTVVFAIGCAMWAISYKVSTLKTWAIAWFFPVFFSIVTLVDLYVDPPLSFYHPVLGYFPGPIYDEWIPKFFSLYTYRLWIFSLSVWLFSRGFVSRRTWNIGLLLLLPFCFRENLGWHTSHAFIQKQLPQYISTEHADIFYSNSVLASAETFSTTIENYIRDISLQLQIEPNHEKIRVYIYPDPITKKRWTGTAYTLIGNPIQRSLHILSMEPNNPILIHELTHVVSRPLGIPILHISPNIGFLEGLATAIQKTEMNLTVHQWARIMQITNQLPNIANSLNAVSFWKESPKRVYLADGSFVQWLMDIHGVEKFKKAYRGMAFEKVYGANLDQMILDWHQFLLSFPVTEENIQKAQIYLAEKPFYQKHCVHEVADLLVRYSLCEKTGCEPYLFEACNLDIENLRLQKKCESLKN